MAQIAALVLAAGASRRFGADKLLHPLTLGGVRQPLIAHSLRPWLAVFPQVTVVVRPGSDELQRQALQALGPQTSALDWCVCEEAEAGMGVSLACGIDRRRAASGWLIGLADMPMLPATAIAAVRDALLDGAALAAPFCDNRRGHPVGFSAAYLPELLALQGDAGARALLQRDLAQLRRIVVTEPGILTDIDQPDDLALLNTHA